MRILPDLRVMLRHVLIGLAMMVGYSGMDDGAAQGGEPERLTELVLLAPGTKVDETLPPGWNHLVIKSVPRLASGDLDSLPGMANSTATLFRATILADVRPVGEGANRHFVLRRIGLGLCVPFRGHDTVVLSQTAASQGIELGMVERTVLDRAEQELRRGRLVARTPTFALFSTPAVMKVGNNHREVLLRYAFLVDGATGALQTLVWAIDPNPARRVAGRTVVLMNPSLVYDCGLDVTAQRLFGAVPINWSFAMRGLPTGQPRSMSPELQAWSVRDVRTPLEADELEGTLRLAVSERSRNAAR
jgi:hypothetical protein